MIELGHKSFGEVSFCICKTNYAKKKKKEKKDVSPFSRLVICQICMCSGCDIALFRLVISHV